MAVPTINRKFPCSAESDAKYRCHSMNMPAQPTPSKTPPPATSTNVATVAYMAPIRHADPLNTKSALRATSMRRAPPGM